MPTKELLCTLEMLEAEGPEDERLKALRYVYDRARYHFSDNHRVQNAMLLLLNGNIVSIKQAENLIPRESVFMIRAQGSEVTFYKVTKDSCNCADHGNTKNKSWCKHRLARAIVLRTMERLEKFRGTQHACETI